MQLCKSSVLWTLGAFGLYSSECQDRQTTPITTSADLSSCIKVQSYSQVMKSTPSHPFVLSLSRACGQGVLPSYNWLSPGDE